MRRGPTGKNCFAFQAPAANATTLRRAGVDVVNLANNHAFDFGPLGYGGTRRALTAARVGFVGAPGEIRVVTVVGQKVALLGFASYRWSSPINDPLRVAALVREASAMAEIVIVFFHGGAEGSDKGRVPYGHEQAYGEDRGNLREFTHVAVDAGADLVLGSGPHVLRGMERYRDRLIAYSLGNLAGWKNFGTGGASSLSALLTVQLSPRGAADRRRRDVAAAGPHRRPAPRPVGCGGVGDAPPERRRLRAQGDRGSRAAEPRS